VAAALIRALTNSDLPLPVFLACAAALKRTMDADAGDEYPSQLLPLLLRG